MIDATLAFNDVHVLISHRISANIVVLLYRSGKVLRLIKHGNMTGIYVMASQISVNAFSF